MSRIFVVDAKRHPLNPCTPARARLLLRQQKAAVLRRFPLTIILNTAHPESVVAPLRLKVDPGSKTTGMALVNDASGEVVWAAELTHRGEQVHQALTKRRGVRRGRRFRHTRYRPARFHNRRRSIGWLPPSLRSRLGNVLTWVARLRRVCSISAISLELAKFDLQQMEQPEIAGVQYQHGTLAGYEVREYVLEKWQRTCAYCGKQHVPLQVEHIEPRARGGTDRVSNLTLACPQCNQKKGNQDVREFLNTQPEKLKRLLAQAKAPLKDAAAVNATRWALYHRLLALGLPVEVASGGRTKWNRKLRGLPKTHWLDAAAVGESTPAVLQVKQVIPLLITATGRQDRQMCLMDKHGLPRTRAKGSSHVHGFRTGDMARAVVTAGKYVGVYVGRIAVRATGSFSITTQAGTVQGQPVRYFTRLHRADGYSYRKGERCLLPVP